MSSGLPEPGSRPLDLVVFGATGFTGRRAAARLAAVAPSALRWGVAARDGARLAPIAESHGVPALEADVTDAAAVDRLAASTRVLLSTAGPFGILGDPVVDACVRHRTHYADLTGEVPWMRGVIERLHKPARASGTVLIPAAGFDSVPADLAVLTALQVAADRGTRLASARSVYRLRGGLNGGTLASALHIAEHGDGRILADPMALVPGHELDRDTRRALRDPMRPERVVRSGADLEHDPWHEGWAAPFFMGPINARVVRRTAALLHAGECAPDVAPLAAAVDPALRYDEFQSVSRRGGRVPAWMTTLALGLGFRALGTTPGRALARRLGPAPGEGPTESQLARGHTSLLTDCHFTDGSRAAVIQQAAGDPGNAVTVRALVEIGLALALDGVELGFRSGRGGVLTPASALGEDLARRLLETGQHALTIR